MVTVLISADSRYPITRPQITASVNSVLRSRNISSDVEISILICGQRKALEVAKKYLHDDKAHNVLSFPFVDQAIKTVFKTGKDVKGFIDDNGGVLTLGDIIICYPMAQVEANDDNMLVMDKICELVEHAMLHLLGEHHEETDE